jgi:hypothetical protein
MRLDEYSIDDLHVMATGELQVNLDAVAELNRLYANLRTQYIAVFLALREKS